jgi:Ca2+-binding EF-hand superfamily protein
MKPVGVALVVSSFLLRGGLPHAEEESWSTKWREDAYADARRALTDKYFDDLVKPGEDTVALRTLMLVVAGPDPTPRQVRRLLDYDPTGDGRVTRDEMYYGLTAFVFFQVERHMGLDADEDGKLTLREHALQVPDDVGRRDEEGYVPRQRQYFEESDLNGDGVVTREELIEGFSKSYLQYYGGYLLGYKAATSGDRNGDGYIDVEEFAKLLGEEEATEAAAARFAEEWGVKDGRMKALDFQSRFGQLTLEEQAEWERLVQPRWEARKRD